MKAKLIVLLALSIVFRSVKGQELPIISSAMNFVFTSYLSNHKLTPEQYIISKFDNHEVIFIGEFHKFKQNLKLLCRLIPLLYRKGVFTLAYEFARREDQHLIDSLLTAANYDERLARLIAFQQYVHWPFQEYIDVYKVAWKLNKSLPKGMRRFRILGLNDSPDWSIVKKHEDRDNYQIMSKVWKGMSEEDWGKVILDSVVSKKEKVLVYSGIHHAFTEYRQGRVFKGKFNGWGDVRMGNVVFNAIGKQAITIVLHAPWYSSKGWDEPWVFPADGYLDAYFSDQGSKFVPIGFDTKGTPFGNLTGENSIYKFGYQNFTLGTFCDGYIYLCPFLEYQPVTIIDNFVNEDNIEYARSQSPDPSFRSASISDFHRDAVKDVELQFKELPKYK